MSVELPKVSAKREADVFASTNAYLRALIDGEPEPIAETRAVWEKVLEEDCIAKD
jgi:hypothetical protein